MTKKKGPPCIRGLKCFEKSGCPQKAWDGEEGCPAWAEVPYEDEEKPGEIKIVKACIDVIQFDVNLKMLRLLAGNQAATESLRNGLCENIGGETQPKSPPAMTQFMNILTAINNRNLLPNKDKDKK